MFEIKQWTPDLDLTEFYATAKSKGFENNASQKMLVDKTHLFRLYKPI
jgi:hypothetical protein